MNIPKCKDCHFLFEPDLYKVRNTKACKHKNLKKYPIITTNEFRTSPKWCPLREIKQ